MKKYIPFIIAILITKLSHSQVVDRIVQITSTETYLNYPATGLLQIIYAPDHGGELRRPLIIVEGFDPGHILTPEEAFGDADLIGEFLQTLNQSGANNLTDILGGATQEYDLVYVNWRNGTDYIQRNALLLEEVIRWVNANKQPLAGVRQPNVVLGRSMGGLVSRYALRRMENNSQNHETRLYISWDSPHRGANVPQGFQHLARHARDLYIRTGPTATLIETITWSLSPLSALSLSNTPAARQMLLNYVNDVNSIDNSMHNSWQAELRTLGYPQGIGGIPFRMIAVSNGSECGTTQGFNPGDDLIRIDGTVKSKFLGDLVGMVVYPGQMPMVMVMLNQPALGLSLLPGRDKFTADIKIRSKANGSGNQIYKNKITYTKKLLWVINITAPLTDRSYNANASTLPYDYYGGGFMPLSLDLQERTTNGDLATSSISGFNQPQFSFIPTPSALDIGGPANATLTHADYLLPYVGGAPPIGTKSSSFNNFATAFNAITGSSENEPHVDIRVRNGNWLADELNRTTPTDPVPLTNCSFVCSPSAISGDNSFCTNSNLYTIPNLPAGATVNWTANPGVNVFVNSPNAQQTNLTRFGVGGTITLTATITNVCGATITISKPNIQVGTSNTNLAIIRYMGQECVSSNIPTPYVVSNPGGSTIPVEIEVVSGGSVYNASNLSTPVTTATTPMFYLKSSFTGGGMMVKVRVQGTCGWSEWKYFTVSGCPSGFKIAMSPNPASGDVQVSLTDETEKRVIKDLIIMDKTGIMKKRFSFNKTKGVINISDLPSDTYIIRVYDGERWISDKIIKH